MQQMKQKSQSKSSKVTSLFKLWTYLLLSIVFISCSQKPIPMDVIENKTIDKVYLGFESVPNHKDQIELYSQTVTQNLTKDQLLHQREEVVEFAVEQQTLKVDKVKKTVNYSLKTIKKEGSTNLHDMAYPELNETIEFQLNEKGKVLKAGKFPKNSLFYLSPMPLPGRTVQVGDTWDYKETWWSDNGESFMELEIILVLKKILKCFDNETCVAIAWNGRIFPTQMKNKLKTKSVEPNVLTSSMRGYMLYRIKTGTQLWSYIRNVEAFKMDNVDLKVSSCIKTVLNDPKIKKEKPVCNASKDEFEFPF